MPSTTGKNPAKGTVPIPTTMAFTDRSETLVDTPIAGTDTTYLGWADPGSLESEAKWLIKRITDDDINTAGLYVNGAFSFDQVWDDRSTLAYS